jgi:hypothetical protein
MIHHQIHVVNATSNALFLIRPVNISKACRFISFTNNYCFLNLAPQPSKQK